MAYQYGERRRGAQEIEVDALRIVQADEGVRRRLMSPREASLQVSLPWRWGV